MTQAALDFETRPHDAQLTEELRALREKKERREIDCEQYRTLHKQAVMNSLERMIKKYAR